MASKVSSSLAGTISVNIGLSVILGLSLKKLWMLMNTFQIIISLPLLNFSYPSNVITLCSSLKDISNLNVLPPGTMEKFWDLFLGVEAVNKSLNSNFKTMDIF